MNEIIVISIIAGLITAVAYAIQGIAEGISARHTKYYEVAFATQILALLFMVVATLVFRQTVMVSLNALLLAMLIGLIYAASLHFYFRALHNGPMSIVSPISGSYSVVAVPIAVLVLGEVLTFAQYMGISLTVVGVFLVDFKLHKRKVKIVHRKYLTYALITLFLWGIYMPIDSILVENSSWFSALFWELVFVNIFLAILLLRRESVTTFKKSMPKLLKASIVIGLCEVFGGLVMNYGLAKGSVAIMTPLITTSSILIVLYAVIILKQRLHKRQAFGVVLALAGVMFLGG